MYSRDYTEVWEFHHPSVPFFVSQSPVLEVHRDAEEKGPSRIVFWCKDGYVCVWGVGEFFEIVTIFFENDFEFFFENYCSNFFLKMISNFSLKINVRIFLIFFKFNIHMCTL